MSMTPQQMQMMLAMYKQQFPNGQPQTQQQQQLAGIDQATANLGAGAPAGTNRTAGGVNGAAQLIAALMKAQKQKQIQQGLNQTQVQAGMPAAQAAQGSAIDDYMQQNPVAPITPGS
jgi:hypothetical protein